MPKTSKCRDREINKDEVRENVHPEGEEGRGTGLNYFIFSIEIVNKVLQVKAKAAP